MRLSLLRLKVRLTEEVLDAVELLDKAEGDDGDLGEGGDTDILRDGYTSVTSSIPSSMYTTSCIVSW